MPEPDNLICYTVLNNRIYIMRNKENVKTINMELLHKLITTDSHKSILIDNSFHSVLHTLLLV